MRRLLHWLACLMALAVAWGCTEQSPQPPGTGGSGLALNLEVPGGDCAPDIVAVYVAIIGDYGEAEEPEFERLIPFYDDRSLHSDVSGENPFDPDRPRPFASSVFFGLEPGGYEVYIAASSSDESFEEVPDVSDDILFVEVFPGEIERVFGVLHCRGETPGGMDIEVAFDSCPVLTDLHFTDKPLVCDAGEICATVEDAEGDDYAIWVGGDGEQHGYYFEHYTFGGGAAGEPMTTCLPLPIPVADDYHVRLAVAELDADGILEFCGAELELRYNAQRAEPETSCCGQDCSDGYLSCLDEGDGEDCMQGADACLAECYRTDEPAALWIAVDDTANQTYEAGQLTWKGAFSYDAADNFITYDPRWSGPDVPLWDDGPVALGGHEAEGQVAGDHIWTAEVQLWADPWYPIDLEYGVMDESGWVWMGPNGQVQVPAGSSDRIEVEGMAFEPFGDVDIRLELNAADLHPLYEDFDWENGAVWVKGNFSSWDLIEMGPLGEGFFEMIWSENLTPHGGLLQAGYEAEFVFVLDMPDGPAEYKMFFDEYDTQGEALTDGVTAFSGDGEGNWFDEEIFINFKGNTAFIVGVED